MSKFLIALCFGFIMLVIWAALTNLIMDNLSKLPRAPVALPPTETNHSVYNKTGRLIK